MTPRAGASRVIARNERYIVALDPRDELRGDAKRGRDGAWTVTKVQWRNGNGNGPVDPVRGPMLVGIVPAGVDPHLQRRLVRAMLDCM